MLEFNKKNDILNIVPIPLFEDNYSYLIYSNPDFGVLVDPADSDKIQLFLSRYPSMIISHIFLTHKHYDHAGGVPDLIKYFSSKGHTVEIVAGEEENLTYTTIPIIGKHHDIIVFGDIPVKCYKVPCHTKGHTLFHFKNSSEIIKDDISDQNCLRCNNFLFTGDTLFIGGCGKFFEGSAQDMHTNLELIKVLPLDTYIFCGHEYTESNLEWALGIEWENQFIRTKLNMIKEIRSKGLYTIPSTLEQELKTNIFLRYNSQVIKDRLNIQNEIEVLSKLRELKNNKISLKTSSSF